jgi:hypothetical protein
MQVQAKDIFVAINGDDVSGIGTIELPFKTIQKAAKVALPGDVVQVRAGIYRETVIPSKSGTAGNPITFQPYQNEMVTISGTEIVTGWTMSSGNIYTATLSSTFTDESHNQCDQIFVDGVMVILARWPNNTNPDPTYPTKASLSSQSTSKTKVGNVTTVVFKSTETPPSDAVGAEIYMQPNFNAWSWTLSGKVTAISGSTITMTSFNGSGADGNGSIYAKGSRFYLFNLLSLLDNPGEWYHDKTKNLLYLWCPDGTDPSGKVIEAKKREFAFNLSNKSYITIKGFNLFACTITTDSESGGNNKGYDANGNVVYPWRGAGFIAPSKNCIVDGITAKYISHFTDVSGHFFLQWGQSSGIVMSGIEQIIQNSTIQYSAGNGITLMGQRCKAINNFVSDVNYNSTDCSGINTGGSNAVTQDHEIAYNTVTRSARSSITPRSLINSSKTNLVARIHHNDLSYFMLQDWDGGGIYTAGDGKFTRIDHNIVHDGTGYTVSGIYVDWGKNFVIDHNVVYNVEWGIHLQHNIDGIPTGMSNMICYNNTIAVKNTSSASYGPFGIASSASQNTQLGTICRNNVNIYRNGTSSVKTSVYMPFTSAFDNAVKTNNLNHPADPKFTDFVSGDLTLLAGSPAIDAGVPMEEVSLDGYTIPAFNDIAIGTVDIGAYEYGQAKWTCGYNSEKGIVDLIPPTAPSNLKALDITTTSFTLTWAAASDNVGIYSYEVLKDGKIIGTVTSLTALEITDLIINTTYSMTVVAKDAAGNTQTSDVLNVKTLAAEAVVSTIWDNFDTYNAGTLPVSASSSNFKDGVGWKSGQGWYAVTGSKIAANSLTSSGYNSSGKLLSISGCNGAATRVMGSVQGLSSTWISFKVHITDNSSINNYIVFKNGNAENFEVNCSNPNEGWRFHYTTPAATSPKANTTDFLTFYLLVNPDDPTNVLKGWINKTSDPGTTIPDMTGSGMVTPSDVSFDRIVLSACGGGYEFDDFRIGDSWSDVDQSVPTGLTTQNKLDGISISAKNNKITADLSGLSGVSIISVIDIRGVLLKTIKSSDSQVSIAVLKSGIYLVRIQNSLKQYTQKVVLF